MIIFEKIYQAWEKAGRGRGWPRPKKLKAATAAASRAAGRF